MLEANNGQWGDPPESKNEYADRSAIINLTDEDQMNRLARALKHLAILAGSPGKELFTH